MKRIIFIVLCCCNIICAQTSSNFLFVDIKQQPLYTGSLDKQNEVSSLEQTNKLLNEIKLNSQVRQLAFNKDDSIFLTINYFDNHIFNTVLGFTFIFILFAFVYNSLHKQIKRIIIQCKSYLNTNNKKRSRVASNSYNFRQWLTSMTRTKQ